MIAPITSKKITAFLHPFHVTTTTRSKQPQSMWITVVVSLLQTSRRGFGRGSKSLRRKDRMCLEERRPLPTKNCCNAEHAKGAMGDLGVVLKFGKAYSMAHPLMTSKKHEDLKFEDYELKSKVFFDRKDIDRVSTPDRDLSKAQVKDVLKDFKKRFAASVKPEIGLLMCKQGFDSLYHGSCRMQPKTRVCCCPEQSLLEAGKKECKEVRGAEKKKFIVRKTPVLDYQTLEWYEGETFNVWQQDDPVWRTPAKKAPMWLETIEPESKGKFQWRKSKLQNASIECTEWEEYDGPAGYAYRYLIKDYCVKHKMTLICDAGKVLYEQVPGIELQYDEFACREGLKNNVISDPDYDERCYCQWERNLMFFSWRLRDSARRKKEQYLGVGPLGWNCKQAILWFFTGYSLTFPPQDLPHLSLRSITIHITTISSTWTKKTRNIPKRSQPKPTPVKQLGKSTLDPSR